MQIPGHQSFDPEQNQILEYSRARCGARKSRKNSNMLKAIVVSMLFFALAATPSGQVADGTPTEQVKATVDQVLRIIREHWPGEEPASLLGGRKVCGVGSIG